MLPKLSFKCRAHAIETAQPIGVICVEGFFIVKFGNESDVDITEELFEELERQWLKGLSLCQAVTRNPNADPVLNRSVCNLLRSSCLSEIWHIFQRISECPYQLPERLERRAVEIQFGGGVGGTEKLDSSKMNGMGKTLRVDVAYLKDVLDDLEYNLISLYRILISTNALSDKFSSQMATWIDVIIQIMKMNLSLFYDGTNAHDNGSAARFKTKQLIQPFEEIIDRVRKSISVKTCSSTVKRFGINEPAKVKVNEKINFSKPFKNVPAGSHTTAPSESTTAAPTTYEDREYESMMSHRIEVALTQKYDSPEPLENTQRIIAHQQTQLSSSSSLSDNGGDTTGGGVEINKHQLTDHNGFLRNYLTRHKDGVGYCSRVQYSACAGPYRKDLEVQRDGSKKTVEIGSGKKKKKRVVRPVMTQRITIESSSSTDATRYKGLVSGHDSERSYLAPRLIYASEKALMRTYLSSRWMGFFPPQWRRLHIFPDQREAWEKFRLKCMLTLIEIANRYALNETTLHDAWKLTNVVFFYCCHRGLKQLDTVVDTLQIEEDGRYLPIRQDQQIMFGVCSSLMVAIKINENASKIDILNSAVINGRPNSIREKIRREFVCSPEVCNPITRDDSETDRSSRKRIKSSYRTAFDVFVDLFEPRLMSSSSLSTPLEDLERQIEISEFKEPSIVYKRACYMLARCYLSGSWHDAKSEMTASQYTAASIYAAISSLKSEGRYSVDDRSDVYIKAAKLTGLTQKATLPAICEEAHALLSKQCRLSAEVNPALSDRYLN